MSSRSAAVLSSFTSKRKQCKVQSLPAVQGLNQPYPKRKPLWNLSLNEGHHVPSIAPTHHLLTKHGQKNDATCPPALLPSTTQFSRSTTSDAHNQSLQGQASHRLQLTVGIPFYKNDHRLADLHLAHADRLHGHCCKERHFRGHKLMESLLRHCNQLPAGTRTSGTLTPHRCVLFPGLASSLALEDVQRKLRERGKRRVAVKPATNAGNSKNGKGLKPPLPGLVARFCMFCMSK